MTYLVKKAIAFAQKAHEGQKRKVTKLPYITHPLQVKLLISLFKESKNAELLQVAAILHDTVEDCNVTIEEIEIEFGREVAQLVLELTNQKDPPIKELPQQVAYLTAKLMSISNYALAIKLCDILHNLTETSNNPNDKFSKNFRHKYTVILHAVCMHRQLTSSQQRIIQEIKKWISI